MNARIQFGSGGNILDGWLNTLPSLEQKVKNNGRPRRKGEWRKVRTWPQHAIIGTLICEHCKQCFPAKRYQINRRQRFCSGACRYHATDIEKFWAKVSKSEKCWNWIGAKCSGRYGNTMWCGKPILAHRLSWTLHAGPIPENHCVCHKCDNGFCVNPIHLFIGTQRDNIRDMVNKGRANRQRTAEETIIQIRAQPTLKKAIQRFQELGMTPYRITRIYYRKTFRNLP